MLKLSRKIQRRTNRRCRFNGRLPWRCRKPRHRLCDFTCRHPGLKASACLDCCIRQHAIKLAANLAARDEDFANMAVVRVISEGDGIALTYDLHLKRFVFAPVRQTSPGIIWLESFVATFPRIFALETNRVAGVASKLVIRVTRARTPYKG